MTDEYEPGTTGPPPEKAAAEIRAAAVWTDPAAAGAVLWLSRADGYRMARCLTLETLQLVYADLLTAGQVKPEAMLDLALTVTVGDLIRLAGAALDKHGNSAEYEHGLRDLVVMAGRGSGKAAQQTAIKLIAAASRGPGGADGK